MSLQGARHWVCWLPPLLLSAGGLAGGFVGGAAMVIGSRWASETGQIVEGSPNVFLKEKR
ncbi:hypothetical protein ACOI4G_00690 [Escherichia coli]